MPGPYTLSGRIEPGGAYPSRWEVTDALIPIVRAELEQLVDAGCQEITLDEPSMSCYGYREDPRRFVKIFADTVKPIVGRCRLSTHLCFGNYKGRAVAPRRYAPLFPAFFELPVDEIHLEMASREFAEIELIGEIAKRGIDVAVGIIDVKNYYVETPIRRGGARALVPQVRARRPAFLRARLRSQSDRALGGPAETRQHGPGCGHRAQGTGTRVIRPAQSHATLLADIRAADRRDGGFRLWWLGQSGFLLQWQGIHVLLDPYLSDSLTRKYSQTDKPHVRMTELVIDPAELSFVDVVTSSHNHTDHLDAETLGPILARNPSLKLVIPEANRAFVADRLKIEPTMPIGLDDGTTIELSGIRFSGVASAHETVERDEQGRVKALGLRFAIRRLEPLPQRRHAALRRHGGKAASLRRRRRASSHQRPCSGAARCRQSVRTGSRATGARHRREARNSLPLRNVRVQHGASGCVRR